MTCVTRTCRWTGVIDALQRPLRGLVRSLNVPLERSKLMTLPQNASFNTPFRLIAANALNCPREMMQRERVGLLVAWIEDAHIRALEVDDRAALKQGDDNALHVYLQEILGCPWSVENEGDKVIDFVFRKALDLAYSDRREPVVRDQGNHETSVTQRDERDAHSLSWEPVLPWVEDLRSVLQLPTGDMDSILRAAYYWVVQCRRRYGTISVPSDESDTRIVPIRANSCSSTTPNHADDDDDGLFRDRGDSNQGVSGGGDTDVKRMIRHAFRRLYVAELCHVQHALTRILAEAQSETADPRAEARLGRVGRG